MSRYGHAAGRGVPPARPDDLASSEGLMRRSQREGAMATLVAVAERGMRPSAPKQSVTLVRDYVRLSKDEAKDPRLMAEQQADEWVLKYGINHPDPTTSRRRR